MFTLEWKSWQSFKAYKTNAWKRWLEEVAKQSEAAFKGGMGNYPPASAPGAWPNSRTGRLRGSIQTRVTEHEVTIGTNTPYSNYLRTGTSKMARRKMSEDALKEGMRAARRLGHWAGWMEGNP